MDLKQYQIVLVDLDPTIGSEMKKIRPCVIISPAELNDYIQTIVIAPLTNTSKPYPTRIAIKHIKVKGSIALDQIRSIDKIRVIKVLGSLTEKEFLKVKAVIKEAYVD